MSVERWVVKLGLLLVDRLVWKWVDGMVDWWALLLVVVKEF
jgi:hypothetical protein